MQAPYTKAVCPYCQREISEVLILRLVSGGPPLAVCPKCDLVFAIEPTSVPAQG